MATIGIPAATSHGRIGAIVATLLLVNLFACVACFWDVRLGWLTGMLFVGVVLTQQLWAMLTLMGRLVLDNEPNSLGMTMLIVVNSSLLIAPAIFICVGCVINRRRIAQELMPQSSTRQATNAKTIETDTACGNPYDPPRNNVCE
ncbi:MAG: hypothetical protein R3C05_28910 [Pirellulaceae bacterium]